MVEFVHPKIYLYRRIVQSKLYMDRYFGDAIDVNSIADEAMFQNF